MWDLCFLSRERTLAPYIGRQSLNHWTTGEIPVCLSFFCLDLLPLFSSVIFLHDPLSEESLFLFLFSRMLLSHQLFMQADLVVHVLPSILCPIQALQTNSASPPMGVDPKPSSCHCPINP